MVNVCSFCGRKFNWNPIIISPFPEASESLIERVCSNECENSSKERTRQIGELFR